MRSKNPMRCILSLLLTLYAAGCFAEQITVETTECYGASGFSSFDEHRLLKIQQGDCDRPGHPGEKLYQILLHSRSPLTRYEVLWVTHDEARSVMAQTRENRDSRATARQRPDTVIINVPPPAAPKQAPPEPATPPAPVQVKAQQERAALNIDILDPPLTRSAEQVLSDSDMSERMIVGQVEGPAPLASLTVNGLSVEASKNGIFRYRMPIDDQRTHIQIVAVDTIGNHGKRDFWLVMPPQQTAAGEQAPPADSIFGNYYGLIIGINKYPHYRDLESAENDARSIDKLLRQRYGFTTRLLLNPTRHEIIRTISEFRKTLTENDNLLIYYAGHGEYDRVNLRGHWLPSDAEPDSPANWISTIDITDAINRMSARHIMVVADSCYSGAISRGDSSALDPGMSDAARSRWLRVMAGKRARIVLTSGGLEPVLDGGRDGHSVFANAFMQVLSSNTGVLDAGHLYQQLRGQVSQRAGELGLDQVPEYAALKVSSHEFADFLFVAQQPAAP